MIKTKEFLELLKKDRLGKASAEEKEFLRTYYNLFEREADVLEFMRQDQKLVIKKRIEIKLMAAISSEGTMLKPVLQRKRWVTIAVSAAALLVLTFGLWRYQYKDGDATLANRLNVLAQKDIPPGQTGATLTLAGGEKIDLSEAKNGGLVSQQGVVISQSSKGELRYVPTQNIPGSNNTAKNGTMQTNTLTTSVGQTYRLVLADGSIVQLNAASSLTYPTALIQGGKRKVSLTGEGYFEIAKDPKHPFVLETKGQKIQVLGTHFNVNAYRNEKAVVTTLVEGSILINSISHPWVTGQMDGKPVNSPSGTILKAGQQASVTEGKMQISTVSTADFIAWSRGDFVFNNQGIENVMRMLSRWYNIEVEYQGKLPNGDFSGNISRNKPISQVLKALESTKLVHFKIEGRKVIVMK